MPDLSKKTVLLGRTYSHGHSASAEITFPREQRSCLLHSARILSAGPVARPGESARRSIPDRLPCLKLTQERFDWRRTPDSKPVVSPKFRGLSMKMRVFLTLAMVACGCFTGCTPVRHNLPPAQHLLEPGPGVGGPGPGVLGMQGGP